MASSHLRRVLRVFPVLLLISVLGATAVRPAHAADTTAAQAATQDDRGALSWVWDLVTQMLVPAGPQIDPDGHR
jgi:hypothetical protein